MCRERGDANLLVSGSGAGSHLRCSAGIWDPRPPPPLPSPPRASVSPPEPQSRGRRGWVCKPSRVRVTHLPRGTRARVSLAAPAGSDPTPTPLCGTESSQGPSLCSPGPPCNKEPLSPCWGRGRGVLAAGGTRGTPPFSPPASGLLSSASSRCQEPPGAPRASLSWRVPGTAPLRGPLRWSHPTRPRG